MIHSRLPKNLPSFWPFWEKDFAKKRLHALIKLAEVENCPKVWAISTLLDCQDDNLDDRETNTNDLTHEGFFLLNTPNIPQYSRSYLAKRLFKASGNAHTLEQFNALFPHLLWNLNRENYSDWRDKLAREVAKSTHITLTQYQQVLQVFVDVITNPKKSKEERRQYAHLVRRSKHVTEAQHEAVKTVFPSYPHFRYSFGDMPKGLFTNL